MSKINVKYKINSLTILDCNIFCIVITVQEFYNMSHVVMSVYIILLIKFSFLGRKKIYKFSFISKFLPD